MNAPDTLGDGLSGRGNFRKDFAEGSANGSDHLAHEDVGDPRAKRAVVIEEVMGNALM
jgi:hypothetical protein